MGNNRCIDAGRENCPCALAEAGSCLVCGRLSGGSCQNCGWQGTCIYTLYEQNGRRLIKGRQERLLSVEDIRVYSAGFRVFVLRADRGFCQKAQTAGAYVFAKAPSADRWYGMPVSVLKSEPDKGLLHLGICSCGPKSAGLLAETEQLCVRGVYYNALSGLSGLREDCRETVIFAKGIAIAPLRNFLDGGSRYAAKLPNPRLYVDLDKVGQDFFLDYFGDLPAEAVHIRQFAREGLWPDGAVWRDGTPCRDVEARTGGEAWMDGEIWPDGEAWPDGTSRKAGKDREVWTDSADCVDDEPCRDGQTVQNIFALTSPYYVRRIQKAFGTNVVRPTEGNMCCGEGVCGACTYVDEQGHLIRQCKAQV